VKRTEIGSKSSPSEKTQGDHSPTTLIMMPLDAWYSAERRREVPMDLQDLAMLVTVLCGLVGIAYGAVATVISVHAFWNEREEAREEEQRLFASITGPAPDDGNLELAKLMSHQAPLARFTRL
jgi:hypothetical protein